MCWALKGIWAVPVIVGIFTIGLISFMGNEVWAQLGEGPPPPPPSPPLVGDFKCYTLPPGQPELFIPVDLLDQFSLEPFTVRNATEICANVFKDATLATPPFGESDPPITPDQHYVVYNITEAEIFIPIETVLLTDQFGTIEADVFEAEELWVPADKIHFASFFPASTDIHWKCYFIEPVSPFSPILLVDLFDQFDFQAYDIIFPIQLCNPVEKSLDDGETFVGDHNIPDHMICYEISDPFPVFTVGDLEFGDQFQTFNPTGLDGASRLCTVASKVVITTLVGGESLPIKPVSLLVAGFQVNAVWMIPALVGIVGAGVVIFKLKRK